MRKKIQFIFIVAILVALCYPILFFNRDGAISERENRTLVTRPYLFVENRLNKNLFSEYSAYFDDRFGGRQKLISLNNLVQNKILKASPHNSIAVKGKENWLFYLGGGGNLKDFRKENIMTKEALEEFRKNVANTLTWCKRQNIPCVFLIGPNKHSVYPEFYPFERPEGSTRADQLIQILQEEGIPYVYSRDKLLEVKKESNIPLYYETDTHWNPLGAYVAYEELMLIVEKLFPDHSFPKIPYETKIEYSMTSGDILPMLRIEKSQSTQPKMIPQNIKQEDLYTYIKNEDRNGVHTKNFDTKAPRALVFRDSFFSALEPFVSPMFSETEYLWRYFRETDKAYVLEYKPDIIIFEVVERDFPFICFGIQAE